MEPSDPLDSALVHILKETGALVLVSQLAQEGLPLDLGDEGDVYRGQQDYEGPR